jgi:G protein beta subunit-like protein
VRLFEVNTNNANPVTSFDGHKSNVTAVGFQKDGKWMFTGSEDGTVKVSPTFHSHMQYINGHIDMGP